MEILILSDTISCLGPFVRIVVEHFRPLNRRPETNRRLRSHARTGKHSALHPDQWPEGPEVGTPKIINK